MGSYMPGPAVEPSGTQASMGDIEQDPRVRSRGPVVWPRVVRGTRLRTGRTGWPMRARVAVLTVPSAGAAAPRGPWLFSRENSRALTRDSPRRIPAASGAWGFHNDDKG
jgi:hypothetical protein